MPVLSAAPEQSSCCKSVRVLVPAADNGVCRAHSAPRPRQARLPVWRIRCKPLGEDWALLWDIAELHLQPAARLCAAPCIRGKQQLPVVLPPMHDGPGLEGLSLHGSAMTCCLRRCGHNFVQLPNGIGWGGQTGHYALFLDSTCDAGMSRGSSATFASACIASAEVQLLAHLHTCMHASTPPSYLVYKGCVSATRVREDCCPQAFDVDMLEVWVLLQSKDDSAPAALGHGSVLDRAADRSFLDIAGARAGLAVHGHRFCSIAHSMACACKRRPRQQS